MKGGNEGRRDGVEMEGEGRRGKEEGGEEGRREERKEGGRRGRKEGGRKEEREKGKGGRKREYLYFSLTIHKFDYKMCK